MIRACTCGRYETRSAVFVEDVGRWRCDACGGFQPKRAADASPTIHVAVSTVLVLEGDDGRRYLLGRTIGRTGRLPDGTPLARAVHWAQKGEHP